MLRIIYLLVIVFIFLQRFFEWRARTR